MTRPSGACGGCIAPRIAEALQTRGYYAPTIESDLDRDGDCWRVGFVIDVGDAVRIRNVDIRLEGLAANDRKLAERLRKHPFEPGRRLRHAEYERHKKAIAELARGRGYFDGYFTERRIDVFPAERAADITLVFDAGRRYRFGDVTFVQDMLSDALVQRFVNFPPETYYESAKVTELYEDFYAAEYFATVEITANPRGEPFFDVPLVIELTPAKPQSYTFGVGFATDTGLKLRADYVHRRLNPRGHQLEVNTIFSPVISEVGTSYRLPLKRPREEWLNFDTGYRYENTASNRSQIFKVGAKRIKRRARNWIETQFVDVSVEDFEIADEDGLSTLVIPGISWAHRRASAPRRPDKGHHASLRISGATKDVLSDATFLQTEAIGKAIRPLWEGGRVLARVDVGYTLKQDFDDLPASVRYFAGGDNSVRGYDYKSLGPTNEDGDVVGGTHRLVGSVELDQRVFGNWSIAAFVDAGNAFDDFAGIDAKVGVGAGVRWYSPLGPIRVDIAVPLADDAEDNFRFHISLGPDL